MQVVEMPKEYSRTQRIGDQMQRELSQLIQREIKDPRVGLVTVTAVEVSRDLSNAKVFVTVMGRDADDAAAVEESRKVLQGAAGFLRMQLGKAMQLRTVPQLRFHYDASIRRGVELSALIERAVAEDRQHEGDASDEPKE
jgi:ribosome-binding factor A